MMAIPTGPFKISKEYWEAALAMTSPLPSFYEQVITAERRYLDEGIRRALSLWVSELEPELMYRVGQTRPFGLTAKGHGTPYIDIRWDESFYLDGESIRYPDRALALSLSHLAGGSDVG